MIEARGIIENIEKTKAKIEKIGGVYDSCYFYTDIVFIPISGEVDLNKEFIRVRVLKVNNWQTKNVVLVHKTAEWKGEAKIGNFILKKEFDTAEEAFDFIKEYYKGKLKEIFRYFRDGWQYSLGKNRIFVEDIEKLGPTIETEAENENELSGIFKKLEITERVSDSVPEMMRKILK
ncbi:hypothetical protein KKB43_06505 [Patescibacteria group bacterium]|nr:hypothetical protein [Patescibacteria group bacterium]MBU4580632.1 hypothetical protein [Patescibacteria group bacterium]